MLSLRVEVCRLHGGALILVTALTATFYIYEEVSDEER